MGSLNMGHGVIATLVRGDEVLVKHFDVDPLRYFARIPVSGSGTKDAIKPLVEFCDAGGWKVRTISSPATIFRDLQGNRPRGAEARDGATVLRPEHQLLANRGDLLEVRTETITTASSLWTNPHRYHRGSSR